MNTTQPPTTRVDEYEQLFNQGECGPKQQIARPVESITRCRGIMFDIDPDRYAVSPLTSEVPLEPENFYERVLQPWLSNDEVLRKMQVRISGTGLHGLLVFDEPVEFETTAGPKQFNNVIRLVQLTLPCDPNQPGITAFTRSAGSINSKNGCEVSLVTEGEPVTLDEVMELKDRMVDAPFNTALTILTGDTRRRPCPICNGERSELSGLGRHGRCYGGKKPCGKVGLSQLWNAILKGTER